MTDREKVVKGIESLRDICNAKSNMAIGQGKIVWAGYANAADDALELLKELETVVRCKDCKHGCGRGHGLYCQFIVCEKTGAFHKEDWYRAYGKRR